MKIASMADVKAKFSGYVKASQDGPGVVTKNGKPIAMLLAVQDEDEIERMLLAYSLKFQSIIHTAEQQIREGKGLKRSTSGENSMLRWQIVVLLKLRPSDRRKGAGHLVVSP